MKVKEIRELSNQELEDKLKELKEELFNLRFQLATGSWIMSCASMKFAGACPRQNCNQGTGFIAKAADEGGLVRMEKPNRKVRAGALSAIRWIRPV